MHTEKHMGNKVINNHILKLPMQLKLKEAEHSLSHIPQLSKTSCSLSSHYYWPMKTTILLWLLYINFAYYWTLYKWNYIAYYFMPFYVASDQLFSLSICLLFAMFRLFIVISSTLYAYRRIYMYSLYYWYVVQSLELSQRYCYKHSCACHLVNVTTFLFE